ncbi:extracellular matrix/biofilm biosynthesis regulator RemA family protein [Paenisporosarcina indica]|uniref:extracellular matrix/biofilm biosynthesis regulator RemA family protein n=1 Tax=Paenisporosarcina indica TaxID=650093 RepID=UPI0009500143|nr:extracellular matrix/biofilm biosynthesis regulator RemA family protein [Paenisporosarcina indica]
MPNRKFINIGNGSVVAVERIISILPPESAPIKRLVQDARDKGFLIDATYGKKTRAIFVMDSAHVVLSAVNADTMVTRMIEQAE